MTPTHTKEIWEEFDKQWDEEFGCVDCNWNECKNRYGNFFKKFISQELSRLEEEKDREWEEKLKQLFILPSTMDHTLLLNMLLQRLDALITKKEAI